MRKRDLCCYFQFPYKRGNIGVLFSVRARPDSFIKLFIKSSSLLKFDSKLSLDNKQEPLTVLTESQKPQRNKNNVEDPNFYRLEATDLFLNLL